MSDPNPTATAAVMPAQMQAQLADLRQQIASLHTIQAAGRRWTLVTVVLVVLLFALFTWGTYTRIKRNFNDQAVQAAVDTPPAGCEQAGVGHADQHRPGRVAGVQGRGVTTLRNDGPAAATAAVEHLRVDPPAERRGVQGPDRRRVRRGRQAGSSPTSGPRFPSVPDQRRQDLLKAFVADQLDAQNKRITIRVDQLYTNDRNRMQATLEKFDTPRISGLGSEGLERQFLHTMVALLDDQVDAAFPTPDAPAPAPTGRSAHTASAKVGPATAPATAPATSQPSVP